MLFEVDVVRYIGRPEGDVGRKAMLDLVDSRQAEDMREKAQEVSQMWRKI